MVINDEKLLKLREDFRKFYDEELIIAYKDIGKIRFRYILIFYLLLIIFLCIGWRVCKNLYISAPLDMLFCFILIWGILSTWLCFKPLYKAKKLAKGGFIRKLLSFFGSNFKYYKSNVYDYIIRSSNLFAPYCEREVDDCCIGQYKNVKISMLECVLSDALVVFSGVLILLEFDGKSKGRIVCKDKFNYHRYYNWRSLLVVFLAFVSALIGATKGLEKILPKLLDFIFRWRKKYKPIYLEDIVFSKKWNVEATDQIEARYLLTPAMMERILEVKKLFKGKAIDFSFFGNKLLIAVHTNKDMFESTSLFSSALRFDKVLNVIHQFYSIFAIIDLLKLEGKKNNEKS